MNKVPCVIVKSDHSRHCNVRTGLSELHIKLNSAFFQIKNLLVRNEN